MEKREIYLIENNQEIKINFLDLYEGDKFRIKVFKDGKLINESVHIAKSDPYIGGLDEENKTVIWTINI